jgi:hypothetical protein
VLEAEELVPGERWVEGLKQRDEMRLVLLSRTEVPRGQRMAAGLEERIAREAL